MPENLLATNSPPVQHTVKGLVASHKHIVPGTVRVSSKWHLASASPQGDTWVRKSASHPHPAPLRSSIRKPRAGQAQFCPHEDDSLCGFAPGSIYSELASTPPSAASPSSPPRKVCAGCDAIITGCVFLLNDRTYCSELHRRRAFTDLQWDGDENHLVARCRRGLREQAPKSPGGTIACGHDFLPNQTSTGMDSADGYNKGGQQPGRNVLASIFAWRS